MKDEMKKSEADVRQAKEEQLPKVEGVLPADIEAKFEFYNFGHALEILTQGKEERRMPDPCGRNQKGVCGGV